MISFNQTIYAVGDEVYVTADVGGNYAWQSSLGLQEGTWAAGVGDTISIGKAAIGGYAASFKDNAGGEFFYSWITLLSDGNGNLVLDHFESMPPTTPLTTGGFSNDILSKYLSALTGDYLAYAFNKAVAALPQNTAAPLGATAILILVFFPAAIVPFLVDSAIALGIDFFAEVVVNSIEAMVEDNKLTAQEGTFLKLCLGGAAFTAGMQSALTTEAGINRAKSVLDLVGNTTKLVSTGGGMTFDMQIQPTTYAPSATVFIHINQPPPPATEHRTVVHRHHHRG